MQQNAYFLAQILGLIRYRAPARHMPERSDSFDNSVEPLFSLPEAPVALDVVGDLVQVVESSGCDLNAKSHVSSEVSAPPV